MPTPKVRIITNRVSEGARALQDALVALGADVSRVRTDAGPKIPRRLNIKWGAFAFNPSDYGGVILNANAGRQVLNKLECFRVLADAQVPIPEFTSDRAQVELWIAQGCRRVYERHNLSGSEGDGIVVYERDRNGVENQPLGTAPLYTKGLRGLRREYRIHVFKKDGVQRLFIQQKKRRADFQENEDYGNTVRNLAHGWIFAHNEIVRPRQQTIDAAVGAIRALSLDFGAVDLIEMDDITQGSAVLEVNSAPGLQGETLSFYSQATLGVIQGVVDQQPTVVEEDDYDEDEDEDNDIDF